MAEWLKQYIPAGCLTIATEDTTLPRELWILSDLQGWRFLNRPGDAIDTESVLPEASQQALLSSQTLSPFADLFNARWIQISFNCGIARVYIFPHDIDRRKFGRSSDGKLTKALSLLLRQLDYSSSIWNGSTTSTRWETPKSVQNGEESSDDDDCSLLERFNKLPSPEPRLDLVTPDSFNAIAMRGILNSDLPGLHTSLYAHQRRSAAVMLQREVEPGRVIDPRLRSALDHDKQPWYYDVEVGLVLKDPRFYDAASGGILAEEMGTGKTLICLALILATKHLPAEAPDALLVETPVRSQVGSLVDMAAAAVNRHSYPWKAYLATQPSEDGQWYQGCVEALQATKNRAYYRLQDRPLVETRTSGRVKAPTPPSRKVYLSNGSLVIVPNNLITQWHQEIKKHSTGLRVLTLEDIQEPIPNISSLLSYDVILFSHSRFERIERSPTNINPGHAIPTYCPLEFIRFKRCIIDEGHKLGSGKSQWNSDLSRGLDKLHVAARWVVTGTPSQGLYGIARMQKATKETYVGEREQQAINLQERDDLQRIGKIASRFLKVRPWSNIREEVGDTPADWSVYVMQPQHNKRSSGRKDCLKATLESLIIRNRLSDVSHHLPPVDEKVVFLDGSYQDKLSLNLFSMMIIFNSVQSQRTDQDYFFHPRQRKALMQLVSNLKQASFFGGVFFSIPEIKKSLETAESFLEQKEIPMTSEDHDLLKSAIEFGKIAVNNELKAVSNQFHSMPLYLKNFPGGNGRHWSLDDKDTEDDEPICTDAGLLHQLQKVLNPCIDAPTSLQNMIDNGRLDWEGDDARSRAAQEAAVAGGGQGPASSQTSSLAGNTMQGIDRHTIRKSAALADTSVATPADNTTTPRTAPEIAEPLAKTQIISTVSAKLSYLIDSIVKYQEQEQMIVFYENDNVAFYLAGALEILQVQHLIYTRRGLDAKRRAQYVSTFTHNPKFRVLLMDISQAAFGLDMRSASRIYFISPVLNPQVEAQAIGRARRISQQKPVSVETLVLRGSIEEVMVERRKTMSAAEHRKVKSILDDKPMYDWILDAKILSMPEATDNIAQTAKLQVPQLVFGREFGREVDPDEDLVIDSPEAKGKHKGLDPMPQPVALPQPLRAGGLKRTRISSPAPATAAGSCGAEAIKPAKKKVRIAFADDA